MGRLNRPKKALWHETPLRHLQCWRMQKWQTQRRDRLTENNHSCGDAQIPHCDGLSALKKHRGGGDQSPDRERWIDEFRHSQH